MRKFILLLFTGILLSSIQIRANNTIIAKNYAPVNLVRFFATTQIVCPLNATSFPASIDVPIKVAGFNKMIANSGSISWDTSVIKYSYIANFGNASLGLTNANFSISPAGNLTFTWNNASNKGITLADSSLFFTIRFNITGTFGNISPITLSNIPLRYTSIDSSLNNIPTTSIDGSVILTNGTNVTISSPISFCQGDSALLTSSSATYYQWYFNGNPIKNANNQTYNTYNTGTYSVLTTLTNGCNTYSKDIIVTAIPPPAIPVITTNTSTTVCSGNSVILMSTASSNYQWYFNGSAISGANSQNYSATTTGNYTVIVKNATGCTSPASSVTTVSINNTPITPIITSKGVTTFCSNNYDTLSCSLANGYQWYLNGNAINGATNQTLIVNNSGTYTATTTNSTCSSAVSLPIVITVNSITQPIINNSGSTNICPGNNVILTTSLAYNYYQWYLNGVAISGANNKSYTALTSGNYTVEAGILGACTLISSPITVTVSSIVNPTISADSSTTFCMGKSVILKSTNNNYATYQWYNNGNIINGATGQIFTAYTTGVYSVIATNGLGCSSLASAGINVTANPIPNTPSINSVGSTTICQSASITLTSSSANNYQWYLNGVAINNETNQNLTVSNAGSYSVAITNNGTCAASSSSITINVVTKTTPTITTTGNSSFCQGGSVQLNAGTGYSSYQWYLNNILISGANSQTYITSTTGAYTVTGISTEGCSSNSSSVVNVTAFTTPTTPVISTNTSTICPGKTATISSTVDYSYTWYLNGSLTNTTSSSTLSATTAGNYTVITTTANGCKSALSNSIAISVLTTVTPTITASGATTICTGDSLLLSTSLGNTYQWYLNGVRITNTNSQSIYANNNGNYSVEVTYPNGCTSSSTPISITAYTSPTPIISTSKTAICPGGNLALNATAGFKTYQWYNNGVLISGANSSTYFATVAGSYSVECTNSFGCSSVQSSAVTLTISTIPTNPIITVGGVTSFCTGGNVVLTANNGYTAYQWYQDGNLITGSTAQSITVQTSGSYSVKATNLTGCFSNASTSVNVNVYTSPTVPTISNSNGSTSFCAGSSLTLTASYANNYQWYLNGIAITNAISQNYVVKTNGSYSVSVSNGSGCTSSSAVSIIDMITKTTPVITTTGSVSFCKGNNVQLNTSGYASYKWYLNNNLLNNVNGQIYTTDTMGIYTVIGTTTEGCVSNTSLPLTVTVYDLPDTPKVSTTGSTSICSGFSTTIQSTLEDSYSWYLNGNLIGATNTPNYTVNSTGNYAVVTKNIYGCSSVISNPLLITFTTPKIPTISVSGNTTFCKGDSVTLTSTLGSSYQWYLNGIKMANGNKQIIVTNVAGNYTVTVVYSSGCSATSNNLAIATYTTPTPTINYTKSIVCTGDSSVLSTTAGFDSYQWYIDSTLILGETNNTFTTIYPGEYYVTTTNNIGCVSAPSQAINIKTSNSPATPTITSSSLILCKTDTVTLSSSTGNTYQWYHNNSFIQGATGNTFSTIDTGNYTVIVYNADGCASPKSNSIKIQQYPYSAPVVTTSGSTNICTGSFVLLTSTKGISYQWYFNNNAISTAVAPTFSASQTGNYYVKVIDNYGCNTYSTPLTVNTETVIAPTIGVIGSLNICSNDSSILLATKGYASYQWYKDGNIIPSANSISLNVKTSGIYTVTGTSVGGCTSISSTSVTVNVSAIPAQPVITSSAAGICNGGNVVLTSSTANSYQWFLNGNAIVGANGPTYTVFSAGIYSVVASNAGGCSSINSNALTINNNSTITTITGTGKTVLCSGESALLTASPGMTYQWFINNVALTGANSQTYSATAAGTYTVAVTNINNCTSTSTGLSITVNTVATPTLSTSNTTVCNGNSALLSASSGYAYYQWYNNGIVIPGITTITYSTSVSGNYTVVGTSVQGCISQASLPIALAVSAIPSAPIITTTTSTSFCVGYSVTLSSTKGSSYQWYFNGNSINNANSQTYTASIQGIYSLYVTDSNGCKSASSSPVTITQIAAPSVPTISASGTTNFCTGSNVVLTASSAFAYKWYNNGILIPGATNQTLTVNTTGNYSVAVFNSSNCSATSTSTTVKASSGNAPIVTYTGRTTICAGNTVPLTANTDTGYTIYQWYNSTGAIAGATKKVYNANSTDSFYVIAYSVNGVCPTLPSSLTGVTVNLNPAVPNITPTGKVVICKGSSVTLTGSIAFTYQWYKNGSPISGAVNQTLPVNSVGNYSLVEYNNSGCTATSSDTATVSIDSSIVSIATPAKTTFCKGDSIVLNATNSMTYQWYFNGVAINPSNTKNLSAKNTGYYTVSATDSNNCRSNSDSVSIKVVSSVTPTAVVNGASTVCSDNLSTSLAGAPGFNIYQWYKNDTLIVGATSLNYSPNSSGIYTLVAYNTGNCPSTPSSGLGITVVQTPTKPTVSAVGGTTQLCNGKNILLMSNNATSYQWFRNGILLTSATNQSYYATNPGYFSVQNNNYGCLSKLSDSVVIEKLVVPGFTVNTASQELCNNLFSFTTINPSTVNKYYWSFADGKTATDINPTHTYTGKGSFTVKQIVTSSDNSCIDSASQTVTVVKCSYKGISEADSMSTYPNPTSGAFKLSFISVTPRLVHLAIIGADNGIIYMVKDIQAVEGKNTVNLNMSSPSLLNGTYIVRMMGNDITYTPWKFVLMR